MQAPQVQHESVALLRAVDAMLENPDNWGQFRASYIDGRGNHRRCLVAALRDARKEIGSSRLAHVRAKWAIRRAARTVAVRGFNDRQRTTIRDVRRVVKEALARLQDFTLADAAEGVPGFADYDVLIDLGEHDERRAVQVWTAKQPPATVVRGRAGDTGLARH